ncbi:MAG: glyoxalase [Cyanobacteria bacterium]|nr:glyoxalase [Cyanobacteria bacterium CG_2015-16_32_12]NCO78276.1 glyoxalase [Cyanobacteria bacterium CG_2015-22_32_23]NCQ02913.1 glyoxalase [Cyanobacteria bacterium CG_2015-09_32_10]NCS83502.1 glyoxalase [Cyanobacteria bacterium CG_2015-02_32_10]
MDKVIFHLAIPINSIEKAKIFYSNILGSKIGRENQHAVIFDFYGHQLVGHITKENLTPPANIYPRHFGLIFTNESDWDTLLTRCNYHNLELYQTPKLRFKNELTEHKTFFLQDPFYNIIELKFYRHYEAIFGANHILSIGDR